MKTPYIAINYKIVVFILFRCDRCCVEPRARNEQAISVSVNLRSADPSEGQRGDGQGARCRTPSILTPTANNRTSTSLAFLG